MSHVLPGSHWDSLAARCDHAVALMTAGVTSAAAWSLTFAESATQPDENASELELIRGVWSVSAETGAPVSQTLRMLAETYRALARIEREVEAAVAGPRMATRLMLTLPAIGVLLAAALGLNILTFFVTNLTGVLCLVGGVALLSCGRWWSRRLMRLVTTHDVPREPATTVIVAGLRAGVAVTMSLEVLKRHVSSGEIERSLSRLAVVADAASMWGMPLADVLLADATRSRDVAISLVRQRCAELGERLLVPLGACVLPAFILLAVVPIVVELISSSDIASVVALTQTQGHPSVTELP